MDARRWLWSLGFAGLLLAAGAAAAQEAEPAADGTLSPYFFVQGAYEDAEPFPLESTDVVAQVSGVIADVTVRQVYRNDGEVPITARYVFPASTRAAVHGMKFRIGEHQVTAKVKPRAQAAQDFKEAEAEGKSATLLEQERPNVFSMSVANVMPGDRVEVELRYSELLVPSEGVYSFAYPTVVGPRYAGMAAADAGATDGFVHSPYMREGDTPPTRFSIAVHLSTGLPLAELSSRSHELQVEREGESVAHVALRDRASFGGNRDFVLDYRLAGSQIQSGLLLYEGQQENHFLLMLQPPARVSKAAIAPREYVFVLDVSGSMNGFPLDTAKVLIADLIAQLRPTDTFNVILFSGDSYTMAPRSVPATDANVKRALEVIEEERGGGGTELQAALRTVHALPRAAHVSRSVVVLTDGYIAEERSTFELIAEQLGDTNVFAFGIGSSVNRYLIEGIARAGQGEPFVVTDPSQAGATAHRFRRYIESPVLTDIEVRFDGIDAYDLEPAVQPDLFAQRPILVSGKYRGSSGAIEVRGRGASAPFLSRTELATAAARAENAALPRLWARTRIARLSDYEVSGSDEQTASEVAALGMRYSLLTKHTSFVAVLEQVRNAGELPAPVDQPLPLPLGVSESAIGGEGGEYGAGAEPELVWLLLPLLALAALRNRHARPWRRA